MRDQECLNAAIDELKAVGIIPEVVHGGKHMKVQWTHNGNSRMHTVPLTPSDWRTPMNNLRQIRTILRTDGLISTKEVSNDNVAVPEAKVAVKNGAIVASSLTVADHFGRAHRDVTRAIDKLLIELPDEFGLRNFTQTSYQTGQNVTQRAFDMTRDGFTMLVMGFTGTPALAWKLKYIAAFNAMEEELRNMAEAASQPVGFAKRLAAVEADLKAMIDLTLGKDAAPGFVYVKAHRRKQPMLTLMGKAA